MSHRKILRRTTRGAVATLMGVSLLTLGGCVTTWQEPLTCAAIGGGLGAVGGGIGGGVHADSHKDWEGAAIAVGSTMVGAGIGYVVCRLMEDDEPEPKPRRAPAIAETEPAPEPVADPEPVLAAAHVAPQVPSIPTACEQLVRLEGVTFASDQAEILPQAAGILDGTIEALRGCESKRVLVEAFTDGSGPESYNQALSQRRADSVRQYLIDGGIASSRIEAKGRGEASPIADNSTREGRARNRRVEFQPVE